LGDYIDRGAESKLVVDFIIELLEKGYDVIPLMGNHEALLLEAYANEKNVAKWLLNGGNESLKSFEIETIKQISDKYIRFFKQLKYFYIYNEFIFVHAGFNDTIINPYSDFYSMLWKCKETYKNSFFADKIIIHGHNPIPTLQCEQRIRSGARVLNIDTGCVYNSKVGFGKLTAYDCTNSQLYFV